MSVRNPFRDDPVAIDARVDAATFLTALSQQDGRLLGETLGQPCRVYVRIRGSRVTVYTNVTHDGRVRRLSGVVEDAGPGRSTFTGQFRLFPRDRFFNLPLVLLLAAGLDAFLLLHLSAHIGARPPWVLWVVALMFNYMAGMWFVPAPWFRTPEHTEDLQRRWLADLGGAPEAQ